AIEAHRHTGMDRFVTVAMRAVTFHAPVFVGDLVSFYSETLKIGSTSITTRVVVEAERDGALLFIKKALSRYGCDRTIAIPTSDDRPDDPASPLQKSPGMSRTPC